MVSRKERELTFRDYDVKKRKDAEGWAATWQSRCHQVSGVGVSADKQLDTMLQSANEELEARAATIQ